MATPFLEYIAEMPQTQHLDWKSKVVALEADRELCRAEIEKQAEIFRGEIPDSNSNDRYSSIYLYQQKVFRIAMSPDGLSLEEAPSDIDLTTDEDVPGVLRNDVLFSAWFSMGEHKHKYQILSDQLRQTFTQAAPKGANGEMFFNIGTQFYQFTSHEGSTTCRRWPN